MKNLIILIGIFLPLLSFGQNVGIGTVDPTAKLHVENAITNSLIVVEDFDDGTFNPPYQSSTISGIFDGGELWAFNAIETYAGSSFSLQAPSTVFAATEECISVPIPSIPIDKSYSVSFYYKNNGGSIDYVLGNGTEANAGTLANSSLSWKSVQFSGVSDGTLTDITFCLSATFFADATGVDFYMGGISMDYQDNHALRIVDGNQAMGKILVSDDAGNATWNTLSAVDDGIQELEFSDGDLSLTGSNTVELHTLKRLGHKLIIDSLFNTTFGANNIILGQFSSASGSNNLSAGFANKTWGGFNNIQGDMSTMFGTFNNSSATLATVWGESNTASGFRSTVWGMANDVSGSNPTAWGQGNMASGDWTTAFGFGNEASSNFATAWGQQNKANGDRATAWGNNNEASGITSTAWGFTNTASDLFSTAWCSDNTASDNNSTVWGSGNTSSGTSATSWGFNNEAMGGNSTTWGQFNTATAAQSTAFGASNTVSGVAGTAFGGNNSVSGIRCTAWGVDNQSSGSQTTVWGKNNIVSGGNTTAWGTDNEATGLSSTVWGFNNDAIGRYTTVFGQYNIAESLAETTFGRYNYSPATGNPDSWISTDQLFSIGIGTDDANRANAVTILKNGNMGLKKNDPTFTLDLPNNMTDGTARAYDWDTYSDGRVKENQTTLQYGLNEILRLEPKSYDHHQSSFENGEMVIDEEFDSTIGLIAQEVEKIVPEAVTVPEDENKDLWSMNYEKLIPVLINSIKELNSEMEIMKTQIEILQKENLQLNASIDKK